MSKQVFREKSVDRVSTPEQLSDYIRVANPGTMIILISTIFLLVGIIVWSIFGRIDTKLIVGAITRDNITVCYVKEDDISKVKENMRVIIDGQEYTVGDVIKKPVKVDNSFSEYLTHIGKLAEGEWVCAVTLSDVHGDREEIYEAEIIIESVAPISFVTN